jgi:hypothetical protein
MGVKNDHQHFETFCTLKIKTLWSIMAWEMKDNQTHHFEWSCQSYIKWLHFVNKIKILATFYAK